MTIPPALARMSAWVLLLGALWLPRLSAHDDHDHQPPGLPAECAAVTNLAPFVDPLPIPGVAVPARTNAQFRLPWDPTVVYENVPMARALYEVVEIDEMIPPEQYKAVAEVISFVFKTKGRKT